MATLYTMVAPVSWASSVATGGSYYIQLFDPNTALSYTSVAPAVPGGPVSFIGIPNGRYQVFVSPQRTGPFTAIPGADGWYVLAADATGAVNLAVQSLTVLPSGPYTNSATAGTINNVFYVQLKGDGSDEGGTINTAIASANSQGGGIVVLMGGKTVSHSTTIVPKSTVILDLAYCTLKWIGATNTPMVQCAPTAGNNVDHFWIINGILDAQNTVGTTQLDLRSWQYGGIDNLWLKNGALTGGVTPALRMGAVVGTDFNNNTVGNQIRNLRISTCQVGIQLDGILANGPATTDNTFVGIFIDDLYQTGIRFVQFCDSNLFYGVRIGFHSSGSGLTNNAGVIFNDSGTPTADVGVYDEQFYGFFVDAPSGPASQKAIVLNWQRQCHVAGLWTSIGTIGGSSGTTLQDNNSQSHWVEVLAANSGTPYQSLVYNKNYVLSQITVNGGAGGGLDTQTATFLPIGQVNATAIVCYTGLNLQNQITKVQNIATAGLGVPPIYASYRNTALVAAVANAINFGPAAVAGAYRLHIHYRPTATGASTSVGFTITYKDSTGAISITALPFTRRSTATVVAPPFLNTGADDFYVDFPFEIDNSATAITVSSTGTFTGTTYNMAITLEQLA